MDKLTYDLLIVLKHNRDGSFATQAKRKNVLTRMCKILTAKYPGLKLKNLKRKHIQYVLEQWKNHKSIKSELAHIRWLLRKLNKETLLPCDNRSLGIGRRSTVATKNKSWIGRIDIQQKIEEVRKIDERVALALELCVKFGLRMKEAAIFRPHENIKDGYIEIVFGTKGGRKREVKILTEEQRTLLETLKSRIPRGRSLVPAGWTLKQFKNRFYYVCRSCGISRKNMITVHGLRHTYACKRYIELTSSAPPVLQDNPQRIQDKEEDLRAREQIAKELGHGRSSVTSAYLGGRR